MMKTSLASVIEVSSYNEVKMQHRTHPCKILDHIKLM